MSVNTKQILRELQADMAAAKPYKDELFEKRQKWISEYNGDLYGNEIEGKATVVSRDVKKAATWQHAAFIDPFVVSEDIVNCEPITFEDAKTAEHSQILLNYWYCRKFERYNFTSNSFKILQRE